MVKKTNKNKNRKKIRRIQKTHKNHKIHKILPINPIYEEKKLCSAIRFYDNFDEMIKHFNKSHQHIESILVSNNPNKEIMKGKTISSYYTKQFLKYYPENKFAQYLSAINNKEIGTTIGFSRNDAVNLSKWVLTPEPKNKIVIFDWDGTLSVIEGLILPHTKSATLEMFKDGITYQEIALYYAGTKLRLEGLQNMFRFLHEKNVEVFVLTNNPVAACDWKKLNDPWIRDFSRHNFYNVVKQFIPQIKLENILCGYETDCFKPHTFSNNKYLRETYAKIHHWHNSNSSNCV